MKTTKKKILISTGLISIAVFLCFLNSIISYATSKYIEKKYAWMKPSSVEVDWPFTHIKLSKVRIDKENISGTTDIEIDWFHKIAIVYDGDIVYNKEKSSAKSEQAGGWEIKVERSDIRVYDHGCTILLKRTQVEKKVVSFEELTISNNDKNKYDVVSIVKNGKYFRDTKKLHAGNSRTDFKLVDSKIQALESNEFVINTSESEVDLSEISVKSISMSVQNGKSRVHAMGILIESVTKNSTVVKAEKIEINHKLISSKPFQVFGFQGTVSHGVADKLSVSIVEPIKAVVDLQNSSVFIGVKDSCSNWAKMLNTGTNLSETDSPVAEFNDGKFEVSLVLTKNPVFKMELDCSLKTCESFDSLKNKFSYSAYAPDNTTRFKRNSGPKTRDWIPLNLMGKMGMAVENLEDPGFRYHKGYIEQAYRNSLIENLRLGELKRGGSTITMQLIKNLYLSREKTLVRKLDELILANSIEKCLSKDQILELYLNVIEFGPEIYGIGPGSRYWFKKNPAELGVVEAFWMASILPNPKRAKPMNSVSKAGIEKLIIQLMKQGKLSELTDEIGEIDSIDESSWEVAH